MTLSVESFSFNELHEAPDSPGIYAWYSTMDIGPADWRKDTTETGEDLGIKRLKDSIFEHTLKFQPPNFRLEAKSTFNDRWHGELFSNFQEQAQNWIFGADEKKADLKIGRSLEKALSREITRSNLVKIFEETVPIFSSPIYIGVATKSLKNRLETHRNKIIRINEHLKSNPNDIERLKKQIRETETNLAARIATQGFTTDQLNVFTLDLKYATQGQLGEKELESLAEVTEWFLNRWYRPTCGRF